MENIRNLTPHTITVIGVDGDALATFPSEGVARAKQSIVQVGTICGLPIVRTEFGDPVDLPEYQEGTYLIVSLVTVNAAKQVGRRTDDLLVSCDPVRDPEGRIIGCRSLAVV